MPRSAANLKGSRPSRFCLSSTRYGMFQKQNDRNKMNLNISSSGSRSVGKRNYKSRYANKTGHDTVPVSGTDTGGETVYQDTSNTDDSKDKDINTDISMTDGESGSIDVRARFFPMVSYEASDFNSREREEGTDQGQGAKYWVVYGTPVIDCRFSLKDLDDRTRDRILSNTGSTSIGGLSAALFDNHHFDKWLNSPDIEIDLNLELVRLGLEEEQIGSSGIQHKTSFSVLPGCDGDSDGGHKTIKKVPLTLGLNVNSDFGMEKKPNWILENQCQSASKLSTITGVTADVEVSLKDEIWQLQRRQFVKRK
ncbi:hypothetical protein I302_107005 [Kwoniella bestiolae CBS 10118]|uniref:Uncharacterized protein n=1 Tax=Kwoniella bestiolae CBS 10118 TaxID=1296100 RepID=A0A1B9FZS1_9TREE|nr:hypothetical protein I302_05733 [Kwoniella bestiolae CBS 10118]OCF24274.1 hypothetical protein I302_05733 [Kwoniella bestiolae CBS 10118]